jgi:hypothetical protein
MEEFTRIDAAFILTGWLFVSLAISAIVLVLIENIRMSFSRRVRKQATPCKKPKQSRSTK